MGLLRVQAVVPWSILNYFLGFTSCSAKDFIISMFFGMMPGTFGFIYIGSTYKSVSELISKQKTINDRSQTEIILGILGLIGVIIAGLFITRETKIHLKKILIE